MSVEEKKFFMEYYFPLFRKLSKEKQTAVGLVAEGMRITAERKTVKKHGGACTVPAQRGF